MIAKVGYKKLRCRAEKKLQLQFPFLPHSLNFLHVLECTHIIHTYSDIGSTSLIFLTRRTIKKKKLEMTFPDYETREHTYKATNENR